MAAEESRSRFWPALITFLVVAGGVYLAGLLATALLKHVILPLAALLAGFVAARVVYRVAGKD